MHRWYISSLILIIFAASTYLVSAELVISTSDNQLYWNILEDGTVLTETDNTIIKTDDMIWEAYTTYFKTIFSTIADVRLLLDLDYCFWWNDITLDHLIDGLGYISDAFEDIRILIMFEVSLISFYYWKFIHPTRRDYTAPDSDSDSSSDNSISGDGDNNDSNRQDNIQPEIPLRKEDPSSGIQTPSSSSTSSTSSSSDTVKVLVETPSLSSTPISQEITIPTSVEKLARQINELRLPSALSNTSSTNTYTTRSKRLQNRKIISKTTPSESADENNGIEENISMDEQIKRFMDSLRKKSPNSNLKRTTPAT